MTEIVRDLDLRLMQDLANLQALHNLKAFKRYLESTTMLFKIKLRVGKLAINMPGNHRIQKNRICGNKQHKSHAANGKKHLTLACTEATKVSLVKAAASHAHQLLARHFSKCTDKQTAGFCRQWYRNRLCPGQTS